MGSNWGTGREGGRWTVWGTGRGAGRGTGLGLRPRGAGRRVVLTAGVAALATLAAGPVAMARPANAPTDATASPTSSESTHTPAHTPARDPLSAASLTTPHAGWRLKDSGSTARFRGLAAVSRTIAWVAGTAGTVLRTHDGGRHWSNISPPGAGALEFRDIEAFDARRAVVLAIGEGAASRVFRTDDAGATWTESFRNPDPQAFYDCLTFFDRRHGIALSDPVDGKYRILSTGDGGRSWRVLPSAGMPPAQQGEAAFAASGQCLVSSGSRDAWIATGGAATSRVLHTTDRGRTWSVADTPLPAGDPARGVFALAVRDRGHALAVGGDYRPGRPSPHAAAVSDDAGTTWTPAAEPPTAYRSGAAWFPHSRRLALAVGPTGSDLTFDGGRTWHTFDNGSYDTVDCAPDLGCWAAGEQGRIARLEP
ncbi:WD40/YVTN/BNR-like repeat-containing protein [Streptomyces tubercidicus]|uniref:Oxidoreductase n=2 Tax=Streptomyces tubercidicus TaxID=47759 RepID=A0A640ULA2_9ACTN|nr:oxidoreductase [Streptomyces tubercidicus]